MQHISSFYGKLSDTVFADKKTACPFDIDLMGAANNDASYVLDFRNRCFQNVSSHDLFLRGHNRKEVLRQGYNFYSQIVHPDDLALLAQIHLIILQTLTGTKKYYGEIRCFSFNIRITDSGKYADSRAKYIMVEHKLVPVFVDGKLGFGLCLLACSYIQQSGNLKLYGKDHSFFHEYSFRYKEWQKCKTVVLTDREKNILTLGKQGFINKEIADILCIGENTLKHNRTALFKKLRVRNMYEAIIWDTHSSALFTLCDCEIEEIIDTEEVVEEKEKKTKKKRKTRTSEIEQQIMLMHENGDNNCDIAKIVGFDEKTIRNVLKRFLPPKTDNDSDL
ncbi:MAG: LuxR C-terminal-related transcriptional regulator [Prevotellaceae bacterium]|jgi:DNA-binding NarL/FixJ family response regulator|nr:LuxR C-terminal-related transcriptional regulator [Prevotellaceae bacterium]